GSGPTQPGQGAGPASKDRDRASTPAQPSASARAGPRTGPERPGESRLEAAPNPVRVAAGAGTTTITWDTGDGSVGQVVVAADGIERDFATGRSGSRQARWIAPGKSFEFRLYRGKDREKPLRAIKVRGEKP